MSAKCWYCGVQLTRRTKTIDHVFPRCLGGGAWHNTVQACRKCNQLKAAMLLDTFRFVFWLMTGRPIFWGEVVAAGKNPKEL
jgi:5-methylcytosine-specific restriction endonuclease McrA